MLAVALVRISIGQEMHGDCINLPLRLLRRGRAATGAVDDASRQPYRDEHAPATTIVLLLTLCASMPLRAQDASRAEQAAPLASAAIPRHETLRHALDGLPVPDREDRTEIMILGAFHFSHADNVSDVKGEDDLDIESEARQAELRVVIDRLKRFKPTQIAVEMMAADQARQDALFKAYAAGTWALGRNETYQLGFRLARELGIDGVSCVDTRPPQIEVDGTMQDWEAYARDRGELARWQANNEPNRQANAYIDALKNRMTLGEYLRFINDGRTKRRFKQFFVTGLVDVGVGDTYLGADLTGYWYRRNTRIFSNIKSLATDRDDRILVIYGASHAWVLEELFDASPEFRVIDVDTVLGDEGAAVAN